MALMHTHFFSETLGLCCEMNVVIPQFTQAQIGLAGRERANDVGHPTLLLLHGMSDDHSIWLRRTSIERYASERGLAVVMPAVHRSYYTNQRNGYDYFTFIADEVPALARKFFRLSSRREDNFVAGLSMGGYGAFKIALTCPERYAAAASLSGAVDVVNIRTLTRVERNGEFTRTFGSDDDFLGSENDLFALAERLAASAKPRPALFQNCGDKDFLLAGNRRFRDHLRTVGLDCTYEEHPGEHEWGFWDVHIQRVLDWLPLAKT